MIKFVGWVNRRIEDAGGNIMERGGKGVARRYMYSIEDGGGIIKDERRGGMDRNEEKR